MSKSFSVNGLALRHASASTLLFLLFAFIASSYQTVVIGSLPPQYTVTVAMPDRRLTAGNRINVTFSISGSGNFLNGSVGVHSDAVNLIVETCKLDGYMFGAGVYVKWLQLSNPAGVDKGKANVHFFGFPGVIDYVQGAQVTFAGSVRIDTTAMTPGSYRIKVVFLAQTEERSYCFEDSVQYEILSFWDANPWVFYVAVPILAAIIGAVALWKKDGRKDKRREKISPRSGRPPAQPRTKARVTNKTILLFVITLAVVLWTLAGQLASPPPAKVNVDDVRIVVEPIRVQQESGWLLSIQIRIENHAMVQIHQSWIKITLSRIVYADGTSDVLSSKHMEDLNRAIPTGKSVTDTIDIHPEGASHPFFLKKPKALHMAFETKIAELEETLSSQLVVTMPD